MARPLARRPLTAYFVLATLITTALVAPLVLTAQGWGGRTLSEDWHWLGALGPIGAACLVVAAVAGRSGLRAYLTSLVDPRAPAWLVALALLPLPLFLLIQPLLLLLGRPQLGSLGDLPVGWWLAALLPSLAYGIGEEAGWRGFALPRLQARFGALVAVAVLTVFHALWHLPFFFYRLEFSPFAAVGFFVGMLAGAVCMAFLYNQSGGRTLLPILWHTSWNVVGLVAFATVPETAYAISTLFMVFAALVIAKFGPRDLAAKARHVVRDPRPDAPRGVAANRIGG